MNVDLLHGDRLVISGVNGIPFQNNIAEGDDTWRVRLTLTPASTIQQYRFNVRIDPFPSMLPIQTRRIPLAFLQQGFNDNWNGRNYVSIEFESNTLLIHFDPEVASYYNLPQIDFTVPNIPLVSLPDILVSDVRLSVDSSSTGFEGIPGKPAYVLLKVVFSGVAGKPISGSISGLDFNVHDFSIDIKFYLTTVNALVGDRMSLAVGYLSEVTSDFNDRIFDTNGEVAAKVAEHFKSGVLQNLQAFLDRHSMQVGAAITPWLLGAAYDVWNVSYDPKNSQPVPPPPVPQGDLVVDYVDVLAPDRSGGILVNQNPPAALTIATQEIPNGVLGTPYSQPITAVAGVGALSWSASGVPPGVVFAAGKLSGMPSIPGVYNVTVTVKDAAGKQASRVYVMAINPIDLTVTPANPLPQAVAGQPYSVVMAVQEGAGPFQWTAQGLPAGLSISAAGVISGVPMTDAGVSTIIARVTDAHGVTAAAPLKLGVLDALLVPEVLYAPRGADVVWKPPPRSVPPGGVPHLPEATNPGNLGKVDHIVVVMMENRSFDHLLGYLSKEGGRSDVEGLKWENDANRTQYNYYNGRYYYPTRLLDTQAFKSESVSPDHSHESVKAQMADGMMHFVSDYAKNKVGDDPGPLQQVMGYYTGEQLPTYDMLAREFAVCDHWFCSHVGPTWPNRFVTLTGDLNRDSYGEPEVNTPLYTDFTPSEAMTLFDHLDARKVSWQYFEQRASIMRAFTKHTFDMTRVLEYGDPNKGFAAAVKAGLPSVTFIDPLFGDLPAGIDSPQDNDDAPPSDLMYGQRFIAEIVTTLFTPAKNPNWAKTMLIVVYDEHGGFYDHVDPPANAIPLTGQNSGKLGPRVPAFVVSPYTPRGMVLKDTFDHGAIAATILRRFCSPFPPTMSPRVSAAADLRAALPLASLRSAPFWDPASMTAVLAHTPSRRTSIRRFKAPRARDSFGSLLGGIALATGSSPK